MKYLADGRAVEVIQELPDGRGFVVEYLEEDGESGESVPSGQLDIFREVFDNPKLHYINKEFREAEERLQEMQMRLFTMRTEVKEAEQERSRILNKLKQVPALRRLGDFVDGKVTHLVSVLYKRVHVMEMSECICENDSKYRRKPSRLKLITLWGEDNGDLSFRINHYRDGSSSADHEVYPACSREEAVEIAGRLIDAMLNDPKQVNFEEVIASADRIGHPVADQHRQKMLSQRIASQQENLNRAQKAYEAEFKKMAALAEASELLASPQ